MNTAMAFAILGWCARTGTAPGRAYFDPLRRKLVICRGQSYPTRGPCFWLQSLASSIMIGPPVGKRSGKRRMGLGHFFAPGDTYRRWADPSKGSFSPKRQKQCSTWKDHAGTATCSNAALLDTMDGHFGGELYGSVQPQGVPSYSSRATRSKISPPRVFPDIERQIIRGIEINIPPSWHNDQIIRNSV